MVFRCAFALAESANLRSVCIFCDYDINKCYSVMLDPSAEIKLNWNRMKRQQTNQEQTNKEIDTLDSRYSWILYISYATHTNILCTICAHTTNRDHSKEIPTWKSFYKWNRFNCKKVERDELLFLLQNVKRTTQRNTHSNDIKLKKERKNTHLYQACH